MAALRHFRDSRRGVYAIDIRDFEHAVPRVAKVEEGTKLAAAKEAR